MRTVYLGLGSNLGDRQSNILQALQRLRLRVTVEAVSDYYEAAPALGAQGPPFLNVAIRVRTDLQLPAIAEMLRAIERSVGRRRVVALGARPIDIDILLVDNLCERFDGFEVPHPDLAQRPFNLVPLAEIAPDVVEPRSGKKVGELAAMADRSSIVRLKRSLHFAANRQEETPDVPLSIERVGVSNVKRLVRFRLQGRQTAFNAEFTMAADLAPDKSGLHMSRFSELLEEATLDVLAADDHGEMHDIAVAIARAIVASQHATRADVRVRAPFGLERWTPVSGKRGEETYVLVAVAHAEGGVARYATGVEVEGMTACPCAQAMVREQSEQELRDVGFSAADARRALAALPMATHNQRGRGMILLGAPGAEQEQLHESDLVEIVENAMSSETYDLLKRPDEFFIVNKAHRNPKFVEDVVRGILAGALDMYADFPDTAFVSACQVNYESIHKHDVFAEGFGTFGELRAQLRGKRVASRTDLAAWLGTRSSDVTRPVLTSTT